MDAGTLFIVQIISAIASMGTFMITFWFKKNPESRYFRLLAGVCAFWAFFYGMELFLPTLNEKILAMQMRFMISPYMGVAIVMISAKHFGWERLLTLKWKIAIYFVPVLTTFIALTWNYHHLFRYDFALSQVGDLTILTYTNGFWFIIYMISTYVLSLLSISISVNAVRGANKVYALQGLVFFLAITIPLFPDLVHQMNSSPIPGYNLSSALFAISSILILWSIYHLQMLNIKPVVRAEVMERLTDPVLLLDEDDRLMDYNSAAATAFSWDGQGQMGKNLVELLPEITPLLIIGDTKAHFPEIVHVKHGLRVIYEVNTTNVVIDGRIKERIIILRDVTIRKSAQDALRERERQYRELLDRAPFPVVLTNMSDNRVLFLNEKMEKKFEVDKTRVFGLEAKVFYANPEDRARMLAILNDKGSVSEFEAQMVSSTGKKFWAFITATTINFEGTHSIFAAFNDISERKQMEDALRVTNKKLMLLSSVSRHDMVNQLTVLSGYLAIAQENPEPEKMGHAFSRMGASVNSLRNMIEFTKDYQELGAREPGWFDLTELVERSRSKAALSGIHVDVDLKGVRVYGDALIEKVFSNLFDNSIRHGGKVTVIRIALEEGDKGTIVYFQDDGVGVAAEDKERIFQRGFGKNTGLGLFLSREILAITGMSIKENGVAGQGARFEISVPASIYRKA
ncbi:MAG: sensory histidine kinase AtoS [Methanomassiliicoccales archaeon PtaU1.Bin124]|nr:MAG: sensory histidine kinase AtoS [Methanomassiliicoccales archaeon PtaU1.Bin124]